MGKDNKISKMESKQMNDVLKVAQLNHQFLVKQLSSKKGSDYSGKWVAVAKRKIVAENSRNRALSKIKEIETERNKILLVQIPKYKNLSLSF